MKCDKDDCSFCMYGECDYVFSGNEQCDHRYIKSKEKKAVEKKDVINCSPMMICGKTDCDKFDTNRSNQCSEYLYYEMNKCCNFIKEKNLIDTIQTINEMPKDDINHPSHYNKGKYEVNDIIKDWFKAGMLDWNTCCAIKYIARCNFKENKIKDLKKAVWYLNDLIKDLETPNE